MVDPVGSMHPKYARSNAHVSVRTNACDLRSDVQEANLVGVEAVRSHLTKVSNRLVVVCASVSGV